MMESMYYLLFLVEMLLFILICYFMFAEESSNKSPYMKNEHIGNYMISIPLIAVNFILIVLSAYGGYSLDYFVLQNATTVPVYEMVSKPIVDYAIWAFVFICLFLIHILLLFKSVFDYMRESTFDEKAYRGERRNL
jgi:lysylphosphatidylglycerol synthetase-like protein (DUF2156 family)